MKKKFKIKEKTIRRRREMVVIKNGLLSRWKQKSLKLVPLIRKCRCKKIISLP
jgi:hypothetical protein